MFAGGHYWVNKDLDRWPGQDAHDFLGLGRVAFHDHDGIHDWADRLSISVDNDDASNFGAYLNDRDRADRHHPREQWRTHKVPKHQPRPKKIAPAVQSQPVRYPWVSAHRTLRVWSWSGRIRVLVRENGSLMASICAENVQEAASTVLDAVSGRCVGLGFVWLANQLTEAITKPKPVDIVIQERAA